MLASAGITETGSRRGGSSNARPPTADKKPERKNYGMFLGGDTASNRGSNNARGSSEPPSRHLNSAGNAAAMGIENPGSSSGLRDRSGKIETDRRSENSRQGVAVAAFGSVEGDNDSKAPLNPVQNSQAS